MLSIIFLFVSACDKIKERTQTQREGEARLSSRIESEEKITVTTKGLTENKNYLNEAFCGLYGKHYTDALQNAEKAKNAEPKNPVVLFVYAQTQSMCGDTFGALKTLDDALRNGFDNKDVLITDIHLAPVRKMDAFGELLKRYGMSYNKTNVKKQAHKSGENVIKAGDVEIRLK
ncbi:MAG TPA: hypothetical protein PLA81_01065 [Syntrophorhabdaceae bacterium]|jgi:hypothetical protein|nr:hypothetical protein [Syntrophorhabdaceae bacterium]HOS04867.1 hypothetical protein [Syntrophorhabdaceae bacterium]HPL40166.1 hypothetical protein [Syntrophorhabdaceae bacterium]